MEDQSKWLPIGEAAKHLGVSRDTLRRWERVGKIKAVRSPTNRRYYTLNQLDQLMNKKDEASFSSAGIKKKRSFSKKLRLLIIGLVSFFLTVALFLLIQFAVFK